MPSPRDEGQTDPREVIPREREDEIVAVTHLKILQQKIEMALSIK